MNQITTTAALLTSLEAALLENLDAKVAKNIQDCVEVVTEYRNQSAAWETSPLGIQLIAAYANSSKYPASCKVSASRAWEKKTAAHLGYSEEAERVYYLATSRRHVAKGAPVSNMDEAIARVEKSIRKNVASVVAMVSKKVEKIQATELVGTFSSVDFFGSTGLMFKATTPTGPVVVDLRAIQVYGCVVKSHIRVICTTRKTK